MNLRFERFDEQYLPELMRWFPDERSCSVWGGPHFRYPYTAATFREDVGIASRPAWMLGWSDGSMAAFGQVYLRVGRAHLGHLAVRPERRGRGIGTSLLRALCVQGSTDLSVAEYSLFVLPDNVPALALYQRLGFAPASYPQAPAAMTPMIYMVASGAAAMALRMPG